MGNLFYFTTVQDRMASIPETITGRVLPEIVKFGDLK